MKHDEIIVEVRTRFEEFIACELEAKRDVAKGELAEAFIAKEKRLVGRMADYFTVEALKRWAEEILKRTMATRGVPSQLILPFCLSGVEFPACYSFRSMANQIRYVKAFKAEEWQMVSHLEIQRDNVDAVKRRLADDQRVYQAARPVWDEFPSLTLGEVLRRLAEKDQGAA